MKLFNKIAILSVGAVMAASGLVALNTKTKVAKAADDLVLTFDLTKNPGQWPTDNSTTLTNYTYQLDGKDYTFGLKNVKCNGGYLMLTQPAALGLPAVEGYALSKVSASNTGGCSTAVNVGISTSSSSANYVTGGEAVTWATKSSTYIYELSGTEENKSYFMYVTSKNAQVTSLTLTYSQATNDVITALSVTPNSKTYVAGTALQAEDFVATVTKNGSAGAMSDLAVQIGVLNETTFTSRANVEFGTTVVLKQDNCIRFTAKYPTVGGGDTYLTADVALTTSYAPVTSLTVPASISVDTGATQNISVTVAPIYAEQAVTFASDNENIATVDDKGVVTGVTAGTCNVTVTTVGLDYTSAPISKTVSVTVNAGSFYECVLDKAGFTEVTVAQDISTVEDTITLNGEYLTFTGENSNGTAVRITALSATNPSSKGQQFGTTSNPFTSFNFTTSNFGKKNITKVKVICAGAAAASEANINVKVGGAAFGSQKSISGSAATELIFEGNAFGNVEISFTSVVKGIYVSSILVYGSDSDTSEAIANEFARMVELDDACTGTHTAITTEYEALDEPTKALADAIVIHDWNGTKDSKGARTLAITVAQKVDAIYSALSSSSALVVSSNTSIALVAICALAVLSLASLYFISKRRKLAE